MNTFIPPTFNKNAVDYWKEYLAEEGYVVLHNILEPEQVTTGIEHFWRSWNRVSPGFVRGDPTTWSIQTAPMMFAKGMAVFNGFGQSDFMWYLRTQPQIVGIFEEVHNTKDLVSSFDGFSVFFSKKQKSKAWWHIDQHPENPVYSVQGAYNFFSVTQESAGFTVVPKSHRTFTPQTTNKKDWIQIDDPITTQGVKLLVPENSFVLWNSRTIHANTGMSCKKDPFKLDRLSAYITFAPRRIENKNKQLRELSYKTGDTCSHWANKNEIKRYPWGFGPRYIQRGFGKIEPLRTADLEIPEDRLVYI